MNKSFSDKEQLKAFINAAQYLAGLTAGQDIWNEAGNIMVKFFGADFAAFGRRRTDGAIEIDHWAFSGRGASARLAENEIIAAVGDVFESSFLTFISIQSDEPAVAAFFPILHENLVIAVMLVGHLSTAHLENETLDIYLAVAGLIGATYSHKISRLRLEDLVEKRTAALNAANTALTADIAERKRAEEELERLFKDVQRSNEELEQFAYVASHDLKEPLRMVASYVRLLDKKYKGQLDAQADQYINFAVDGALRMQKLIEDLLAYSRITRRVVEFGQVDTNAIFAKTLSNLSAAIGESNVLITKDDLPTVSGDETQLIQLMQNLIGNAIKFRRPDTAPRVHISAKTEGREWVFSVRDNGIGISPASYDRIFLIFQRLHAREEYPGTGIGLALCKRIVERHNGRIWLESVPGDGTTFFFSIPVRG